MKKGMKTMKACVLFYALGLFAIAQPFPVSAQSMDDNEQHQYQEIDNDEQENYQGEREDQDQEAYDPAGEEGYDPAPEDNEGLYLTEQQDEEDEQPGQ